MRFRQLRNACENELAKGHEWQQHRDHDAPGSPDASGSPGSSGSPDSTTGTASTSNNSPTSKSKSTAVVDTSFGKSTPGKTTAWKADGRRSSISSAKKRLANPISMIRNRLRGASYHQGKMNFLKLFSYYDRDNSGHIDKPEFISLVRRDGKISYDAMSNKLLSDIFDKDVDVNGDGDITHIEFETWILQDYQKRKSITIHPDDQGQQMDTFTRLHLSAPKYTAELQKNSSPRQRRTSLNNPESGGDFRACLRGGHNSEAAKAWRQNYHTKVDTKTAEYPVLYAWEKKSQSPLQQSFGSGEETRRFASPVTESAKKAKDSHYMGNIHSLRTEAKDPHFKNEKLKLAFGRRVPRKIVKQSPSKEEKNKKNEPMYRTVCNFAVQLTEDEYQLYKRLQMSIPVEQDHYQAVCFYFFFKKEKMKKY